MSISMHQAHTDRIARPDELVASGHQVEMVFKRGQKALSLRAQKLWHLLIKAAGVKMADNVKHCLPLSSFYEAGIGHMTREERIETLRELQATFVEVTIDSPKIRGGLRTITGALLSSVERDHDDRGDLEWTFSPALLVVFANSDHWAVLSKRAVMAFESRYSLRLYEIVSLRSGLDHKASEIFDLETFRDRLGVPVGKMTTWSHFRQFALEPAIAEVNHLAGFSVAYEPIKRGRSVAAVKLSWGEKSALERKATKRELDGSKVGRKARRKDAVEKVVGPFAQPAIAAKPSGFPSDGSIFYNRWGDIARQYAPRPTPDLDLIASAFRKWAYEKGLPFDTKGVEKAFIGFCKRFKAGGSFRT